MKLFVQTLTVVLLQLVTLSSVIYAQRQDRLLEGTNLEVHWEASIGGSPLANSDRSFGLWQDKSQRREIVRVLADGKLIQSFRGDEIDQASIEATLLSGRSASEAARLGLEGARAKAERIGKLYERVGHKVEIQEEVTLPTYAITVGSTGVICSLDAESGITMWKNQLPNSRNPIVGPGISDKYVVVVSGNEFYAYDLRSGNLVSRRKLPFVASGPPVTFRDKIAIPSIGGRLIILDILDATIAPELLRVGDENRIGVVVSPNEDFLAWPMKDRLIVAKLETPPVLYFSQRAGDGSDLPSRVVVTPRGFLVASHNGAVSLVNTNREQPFVWKSLIGTACNQPPVVGPSVVAVVSQDSRLFAMNLNSGELLWRQPIQAVESVLNVTDTHVYGIDTARNLITIRLDTARVESRVFIGNKTAIRNSTNNRVFVCDQSGKLSCLREPNALVPVFYAPRTKTRDSAVPEEGDEEESSDSRPTETHESNPFADEELDSLDDDSSNSDPFGDFDSAF